MGKEAKNRKEKRNRLLARLAQENPKRFEQEWDKRVQTWAGTIWNSSKDRAFFREEEFQALLEKYPLSKDILKSIAVPHHKHNGIFIYLNTLSEKEEILGNEVVREILKHMKRGTLIGQPIFGIVEHAKKVLAECGEKAVTLHHKETESILLNEYCKAVAPHIDSRLYRINAALKKKEGR